MQVSAISNFPKFQSITEEYRQSPNPVSQTNFHHNKNRFHPISVTGWCGVGAIATAIIAGVKKMPLLHKISGYVAVAAVASHIGVISALHHAHHKEITK